MQFTDADGITVKTIIGVLVPNYVYWRGCKVTVYENDAEGQECSLNLEKHVTGGQGVVTYGSRLFMVGGQVREEEKKYQTSQNNYDLILSSLHYMLAY